MPEIRTIETTAEKIMLGDLIPRQGAAPAKVIKAERKVKKMHILTDASDKALVCEFIQPMTVKRSFKTDDERIDEGRVELRRRLRRLIAAYEQAKIEFIERITKNGVIRAIEWSADDIIQAETRADIARQIFRVEENKSNADEGADWPLERCVLTLGNKIIDEVLTYGRVDRSSSPMHNEVALAKREAELRFVGRWTDEYTTAEELAALQGRDSKWQTV